jgi:hypothetical protein
MRSLRSFSFFRPAKAIFVPGMYCEMRQHLRENSMIRDEVETAIEMGRNGEREQTVNVKARGSTQGARRGRYEGQETRAHVRSGTHLFRVLEVLEERLLVPGDALVDVGGGVGEVLRLASVTAEDTMNRG